MYNWFIKFPNFTVRIPSFLLQKMPFSDAEHWDPMIRSLPVTGGVMWNRRREMINVVSHLSGFKSSHFSSFFLGGREEWEILIDEGNSGCDFLWPPTRRLGMRARSYSLLANRCTMALRWGRFGEDWRNLDHVPVMLSQLDSAGLKIECWTESYGSLAKWSSFFLELPRLDSRNVINLHEAKLADICPQISPIVPVATWTTRFKWVSSCFGHGSASPVLPSTQVLPKKCRPVQMNGKKWWSRNHRLVKHLRRPKMSLKRQRCLCLLCLLYLLYHWQTWDREKGPALETRKVIRVLRWLRWRWAVANVDVRMLQLLMWFELFILLSSRFVILCVSCFVPPLLLNRRSINWIHFTHTCMMKIQNHRHMVVDHSSSGLDRTHWCSHWFSDVPPPKAGGKQHLERRMKAAFKGWSRRRDEAPSAKTVAERGRVLWQMAVMSLMPHERCWNPACQ